MRHRNEVANSALWTQVLAILGITFVSVAGMFIFNKAFFEPFGTAVGQVSLLAVGVLIFGNVFWLLKLSELDLPIRLLASGDEESQSALIPLAEGKEAVSRG